MIQGTAIAAPIMGGYVPFRTLWESPEGALFASEQSAKWFVHAHRERLVKARAIAVHLNRMMIHRERFDRVAEKLALARAGARE